MVYVSLHWVCLVGEKIHKVRWDRDGACARGSYGCSHPPVSSRHPASQSLAWCPAVPSLMWPSVFSGLQTANYSLIAWSNVFCWFYFHMGFCHYSTQNQFKTDFLECKADMQGCFSPFIRWNLLYLVIPFFQNGNLWSQGKHPYIP